MAYSITEAQAVELLKIAGALVGKQVKSGYIAESDRDDYTQELMLIMVSHQSDWNVPMGVKFEAFANTVMRKRLISVWRGRHKMGNLLRNAESLNATFCNDDGEEEEFINLVTDSGQFFSDSSMSLNAKRLALIWDVRIFLNTLPERERYFCKLLIHYGVSETRRILKEHRMVFLRRINRIRIKMQHAGINPKINFSKITLKGCDVFGGTCDSQR